MGRVSASADTIRELTRSHHSPDVRDTAYERLQRVQELEELVSRNKWGQVFQTWKDCRYATISGVAQDPWHVTDEADILPEIYGINWGELEDIKERLANLAQVGDELGGAYKQARRDLESAGEWDGMGSEEAYNTIDEVVSDAGLYEDLNAALAGALDGYSASTKEAADTLENFTESSPVSEFMNHYGAKTDEDVDLAAMQAQELANLSGQYTWEELGEILVNATSSAMPSGGLGVGDFVRGLVGDGRSGAVDAVAGGSGRVESFPAGLQTVEEVVTEVESLDAFADRYVAVVSGFQQQVSAAHQLIVESAEELGHAARETTGGETVPFARLQPPEPRSKPAPAAHDTSAGRHQQAAHGPSGVAPAQAAGGGVAAGTTPSAAQAEQLDAAGAEPKAATAPSAAVAGGIEPDSIEADGDESARIGAGTGNIPTNSWGGEDALTVSKSDRELSATELDGHGRMAITVDDGSGETTRHRLQFGDGPAAGAGKAVGAGLQADPAGSGDVHRPGPDGTIVIEEGGLTLRVEQPDGPEGPVELTVDDSTGEPTTYTLEAGRGTGEAGGLGGQLGDDGAIGQPEPAGRRSETLGAELPGESGPVGGDGAGSTARSPVGGDLGGGVVPGTAGEGQSLNAGNQTGAAVPTDGVHEGSATPAGGEASGSGDGQQAGHGRMGGMMGAGMMGGAGGGAGGDQEHSRRYQTGSLADLFDDLDLNGGTGKISGVLDDDDEEEAAP